MTTQKSTEEPPEPVRILQHMTEETKDIILDEEGQNNLTKWILRTKESFFLGVRKKKERGYVAGFKEKWVHNL